MERTFVPMFAECETYTIFSPSKKKIKPCNGNTLEQFLAAVITERFDDKRMKHEWSTHTAGLDQSTNN